MFIRLFIKICLLFVGVSVLSCSSSTFYVYNSDLKKVKIDLNNPGKLTILEGFVSCKNCVSDLTEYFKDSLEVRIISIVDKNRIAILQHRKTFNSFSKVNNTKIYYQFSKKSDPYSYKYSNRIFRSFGVVKSPIIIFPNKKGFSTMTYNEFMKN